MKKLYTLLAVLSLIVAAVAAQAQPASKIIGTYKVTGIANVIYYDPNPLPDSISGKVVIRKMEDNVVELSQIIKGVETPLPGLNVVESNTEEGLFILYFATPGGCVYGTVRRGSLEYTVMYKDDNTGKTSALTVYAKK